MERAGEDSDNDFGFVKVSTYSGVFKNEKLTNSTKLNTKTANTPRLEANRPKLCYLHACTGGALIGVVGYGVRSYPSYAQRRGGETKWERVTSEKTDKARTSVFFFAYFSAQRQQIWLRSKND